MIVSSILIIALDLLIFKFLGDFPITKFMLSISSLVLLFLIVHFFRVPHRNANSGEDLVIAPADGKVVVIEEVEETEYFNEKRIQVSIFMSPLNVHVNYYPVEGETAYYKYHPGKYLVAWHPKSSTDNERTTVVLKKKNGVEVLFRQIAGAVARRIVCYAKEGEVVSQNQEVGFIKFGSRIDLLLPLDSEVLVELGDKVQGQITTIARFS